jgi:hypothetical protein
MARSVISAKQRSTWFGHELRGWREMQEYAWLACQPRLDLGVLVRHVVVDDQMQVQLGRGLLVDCKR